MATQATAIELSEQRPQSSLPPTEMTDAELLTHLQTHLFGPIKKRLRDHLPYLMEARERFGQQGRRVPIKGNPTWTEFCEEQLGVGVRNVQKLLAEGKKPKTEAKKRQRQRYDAVDIRHLETVAKAAQTLAERDVDNPAYNYIREAIAEKPEGSPFTANENTSPVAMGPNRRLYYLASKVVSLLEIREVQAALKAVKIQSGTGWSHPGRTILSTALLLEKELPAKQRGDDATEPRESDAETSVQKEAL